MKDTGGSTASVSQMASSREVVREPSKNQGREKNLGRKKTGLDSKNADIERRRTQRGSSKARVGLNRIRMGGKNRGGTKKKKSWLVKKRWESP